MRGPEGLPQGGNICLEETEPDQRAGVVEVEWEAEGAAAEAGDEWGGDRRADLQETVCVRRAVQRLPTREGSRATA